MYYIAWPIIDLDWWMRIIRHCPDIEEDINLSVQKSFVLHTSYRRLDWWTHCYDRTTLLLFFFSSLQFQICVRLTVYCRRIYSMAESTKLLMLIWSVDLLQMPFSSHYINCLTTVKTKNWKWMQAPSTICLYRYSCCSLFVFPYKFHFSNHSFSGHNCVINYFQLYGYSIIWWWLGLPLTHCRSWYSRKIHGILDMLNTC